MHLGSGTNSCLHLLDSEANWGLDTLSESQDAQGALPLYFPHLGGNN